MSIGFPKTATRDSKTGLRYPTSNFVKPTHFTNAGTFFSSNNVTEEGSSGAGIFVLDRNSDNSPQLILAGIHIGLDIYGAVGIQTYSILKNLKLTNFKTYNLVKSAIEKNSCD